jgi:hypothetical protein
MTGGKVRYQPLRKEKPSKDNFITKSDEKVGILVNEDKMEFSSSGGEALCRCISLKLDKVGLGIWFGLDRCFLFC